MWGHYTACRSPGLFGKGSSSSVYCLSNEIKNNCNNNIRHMYGKNKIEIYTYNNNRGRICEKKNEIQERFMKLQCRIQNQ